MQHPSPPDPASVDVLVIGRVQGVGFRFFAHETACRLGLRGYVMNLRSGAVRAYAEGSRQSLEEFVRKMERGPAGSVVQRAHAVWGSPCGQYARFSVESTR